jgi:hypothetical protein
MLPLGVAEADSAPLTPTTERFNKGELVPIPTLPER